MSIGVASYEGTTSTAVGTTEYSLPNNANYSAGSAITADGKFTASLDCSAMAAGDQFRLRVYEKVTSGGAQIVKHDAYITNAQGQSYDVPEFLLMHGWDITLEKISGTDRSFSYSIRNTIDTDTAAIKAKTDNLPAAPAAVSDIPTANANADALLDRTAGVETNRTIRQAMRLMLAVLVGKASGLGTTTAVFRDTNDTKNRISATVDVDGNRSAVTLDAS